MAGRYIVIEVDTSLLADAFLRYHGERLAKLFHTRIVGVYLKPKSFCECPDSTNASSWHRGAKYGIYICKTCKKPSRYYAKGVHPRLEYALGNNLLETNHGRS